MAVSSSPILSLLGMNITATDVGSYPTNLSRFNFCCRLTNNRRPSPVVVHSSKSSKQTWSEAKKLLLEQYGFNPDDDLSEPSRKRKKKKKGQKESGKDEEISDETS